MSNNLAEEQLSTENVYNGVLLNVHRDEVKLPNGNKGVREYFTHVGAACIVAITDDDNVIVEKQFRYPFHKVVTEIPAGKLDSKEENPLAAAKREFLEETGYTADNWQFIGEYYPSVAYTDECIYMYIATGLHAGECNLDEDEFINIEKIPFEELLDKVMSGEIKDGKTQAAVLKAAIINSISKS